MQITLCPTRKVPDLQAFIDTYWRRGHILARDADLLRWQYRYLEDPDYLSVLIAQENEKILGFLGRMPVSFSHYGERVNAVWLSMWMVIPERRHRFLGLEFLRKVDQHRFDVVGCLGLNENTGAIFPRLKYEVYESFPRWVCVISPSGLEKILAEHPDGYPAEAMNAWKDSAPNGSLPIDPRFRLVDWNKENIVRWDQAWEKRLAPHLLGIWRDAEYIRWRYVDHPVFRYFVSFVENTTDGTIRGLLVYRIEEIRDRKEKVLRIVEFLSEDAAAKTLIKAVLDEGEQHHVAFADFYCTSGTFARPLESAGFVKEDDMPSPLPHLFQPLDFRRTLVNGAFWVNPSLADDCHAFFRKGTLYVTTSDGDQDRPN